MELKQDKPESLYFFRAKGTSPWTYSHNTALQYPKGNEINLFHLLEAIAASYRAGVATDGYGRKEVFLPLLIATQRLLNFDVGRFDCGTIDTALRAYADLAGMEDEEL